MADQQPAQYAETESRRCPGCGHPKDQCEGTGNLCYLPPPNCDHPLEAVKPVDGKMRCTACGVRIGAGSPPPLRDQRIGYSRPYERNELPEQFDGLGADGTMEP